MKDRVAKEILKYNKFYLITHIMPDGDSIGSMVALYLILKRLGKEAVIIKNDIVPKKFNFMMKYVNNELLPLEKVKDLKDGVVVSLDCGDMGRLGGLEDRQWDKLINIDHHLNHISFGDISWVNDKAAAVGEMIYELLTPLEVKLDKGIAECLYTSIIADTGNFKFSNTSSRTHRIVASLMELDFDYSLISDNIFDVMSYGKSKLLGYILDTFKDESYIVWAAIPYSLTLQYDLKPDDFDGLINYLLRIDQYKVAVLFKEIKGNEINISFRSSSDDYNVGDFAQQIGGGGHFRASGCTITGELNTVVTDIMEKLKEDIL